MRCLEREPADRYASALDFADDLERWLEGKRINAPALYSRLSGRIRRAPILLKWIAGSACVFVFLPVAASVFHMTKNKAVPAISVAVAIEAIDQEGSLKDIAQHLNAGLRSEFSKRGSLKTLGEVPISETSSGAVFDPLAYGRKANAQFALTGIVRCQQTELRITTRLLRCDTGEIVWLKTSSISSSPSDNALAALTESLAVTLEGKMNPAPSALRTPHTPNPEALAFLQQSDGAHGAQEFAGHEVSRRSF